ncbi:DNA-directed RNA polymerase III subunit RPC3 [Lasiosphaeria miniovina]|uniref:DNA-directed RNA polymerase III subunit RPC3 n=1 Tax=Lasiosphaeria miniovina TaxID=1954250 RepID=A0AA40AWB1_9PEZI|nr:DNA-directed RNA polymerase III subunit RPC3 [Lasiosphaeria miniovina]KAK0723207.1 DNA-directed RNA polymerase III subunit RPC3 [Lasiosphaeria miniovina]
MNPRQLRHGLAVLLQYNMLFYSVEPDTEVAVYEANVEYAYNLIRTGKILEMIDTSFGAPAKDIMQSLLLLGQARISDLIEAYQQKIDQAKKAAAEKIEDGNEFEVNSVNGHSDSIKKSDLLVKSTAQLNSVICRLVEADLIDVVHSRSFQTPQDIHKSVEKEVTERLFPGGPKGGKAKIELQDKIAESLRKIRSESKSLKRKLEQNVTSAKRRKLFSGGASNGAHDEEVDPDLDSRQVIRINYEKCLVDLRNRRLVQFATDIYGEATAYVYGVLLRLLTKPIARCRPDPVMDIGEGDKDRQKFGFVTIGEILDSLKTSVDLSLGLGKVAKHDISSRAADAIQEEPPKPKLYIEEADVDEGDSADEAKDGDGSNSSGSDSESDHKERPATNGSKVQFADSTGAKEMRLDRPAQLRQHLLLLSESNQHFVRHCGPNEWTVDFVPLMSALREFELDSVIERTSGRQGLRLVRILRTKGKLDEKALPTVALMKKPEVQQKMLEMQNAGFVHVQEVPRDTKADVKKSFFLWFSDVDKSLARLLDTSYKTTVRCIQVLEVLRQREKDVLELTKRTDVRGRERDVMRKEYFDRYSRFLENERKLFAQVMRLDDLVAVLRDF